MRIIATTLFALLILLGAGDLQAQQNSYYWSGGQKIDLEQDRSTAVLVYKDAAATQGQALAARRRSGAQAFASDGGKQVVLQFDRPQSGTLATALRDAEVDRSNLKWFSYGFRNQADVEYLPTNRIVFELKEGRPLSEVHALVPDGVQFESAKYFRYVVAQSPDVDLLALANRIYESGLVKYAHPDFMVEKRRTADPLYDEQYYLKNTSSNLDTADVDIEASQAWNLTKGSSQIRVAVIDDGVEAHEDLENASGNSRVLSGYTPQTGGNGRPTWDQRPDGRGGTETAGHGVACAGIVAATHNSVGVRGVAPNVKIVPINIFNGGEGNRETPSEIAEGINWAWDEGGADVLNNSWGYPPSADFGVIENAIQDARTQGRNGKGSVVVFSAGNFRNGSQVTETAFPASVSGVMAVGAVDKNDNRWDYTPSAGNDVDVVTPSGDTQLMGDVRTTDRMGTLGYERSSGDDYTPRFGGTSAAAPQAAGVAALMLSVNAGLSESEVRAKIEATADDYGSTNWDGEGRLNAFQAVDDAIPQLSVNISGPYSIDSGQSDTWYALVDGGVGSASYSWEVKPTYASYWTDASSSGSSCTTTFYNTCDQTKSEGIRVTVSKKTQSKTASQTVFVSPSGSKTFSSSNVTTNAPPCSSTKTFSTAKAAGSIRLAGSSLQVEGQTEDAVRLSWWAGRSRLPSRFVVQHRADTTGTWSRIGTVVAGDSAGADAAGAVAYRFRAGDLRVGTHQFRLAYERAGQSKSARPTSAPVTARVEMEENYRLQSYPNPVRKRATLELAVKEAQEVSVAVYDVLGRRVTTLHDGRLPAQETRQLSLDASRAGLSSGPYFVRVQGERFAATERLTVVQ